MRTKYLFLLLFYVLTASAQTILSDYDKLKAKTDKYLDKVQAQPDWLLSRLQMYWTSQATDVYVKGETFDHPGSERAPFPTVKLDGTRSHGTDYNKPKLEDVVPYDDDSTGCVTMINKTTGQMERVHPSKTGRQTLVGMVSFEVIHEDGINELTEMYPLLLNYEPFQKNRTLYDAALKKWAENIIANGVPHNNWDLIQANFIVRIALVLDHNESYTDERGREYYLDYVLNQSSIRKWSMKRLADYGFDAHTHIWSESPGYSTMVIGEFATFANTMDEKAGIDMFREIPAIEQAIFASPQYLFPNRMICGFGDTHPNYLSTLATDLMIAYAERHGKQALKDSLTALRHAILPEASAQDIERFVTKTFYSPNVSWVMQRTGMDKQHDLAVSLNGALGNHQHANGISMELYGKGFVLGPDAGIGRVLYGGDDYKEYYSRFPAHNTVCVDGASDHTVMMSQHPFEVQFLTDTEQATVSQVSFVEPETQSDQLRTNGIVKTEKGGYYIDIFRSKRKDGKDKFHDYFYHNLGQTMTLTATDGSLTVAALPPLPSAVGFSVFIPALSAIAQSWQTCIAGQRRCRKLQIVMVNLVKRMFSKAPSLNTLRYMCLSPPSSPMR